MIHVRKKKKNKIAFSYIGNNGILYYILSDDLELLSKLVVAYTLFIFNTPDKKALLSSNNIIYVIIYYFFNLHFVLNIINY